MNQQELDNQYYDLAREYLDEYVLCPDAETPFQNNEHVYHSAHVALVNLLVSAYLDGANR